LGALRRYEPRMRLARPGRGAASACSGFTGGSLGLDTRDLKEVKALLEELS